MLLLGLPPGWTAMPAVIVSVALAVAMALAIASAAALGIIAAIMKK